LVAVTAKPARRYPLGTSVWVDCLNGYKVLGVVTGGGMKRTIVKCAPWGIEYTVPVDRIELNISE
jgi:hypothetical protein